MKIRVGVRTNKVGSEVEGTIEIEKEEWQDMNEMERDGFVLQHLFEMGMVEYYYDEDD
jgi:hypothetical protein